MNVGGCKNSHHQQHMQIMYAQVNGMRVYEKLLALPGPFANNGLYNTSERVCVELMSEWLGSCAVIMV